MRRNPEPLDPPSAGGQQPRKSNQRTSGAHPNALPSVPTFDQKPGIAECNREVLFDAHSIGLRDAL